MRRLSYIIVSLIMVLTMSSITAFARPDWPTDTGVQSEAGIVMDMDSGAVLFAQNIHEQKIPASITKLLTALVVIENCDDLDDKVTFSHDAVYNVESGSGNKLALEEGDVLSVRECLYVMLLQSSNQAANALAEYIGGSRSGFVDMMNRKVADLGCQESHFANPSGLNDDTQRTSAYDMALIARAAFQNQQLLEISSTRKASIPATINNPDGRTFSMEHKLLITEDENSVEYYPDAVAGKTGWTSQAGQTLVTYARRGGRGEIAVTLRSTQKTHYSDTKTILDFGFARFQNVNIADNETEYVTGDTPVTIGGETYQPSELYIDKTAVITIPNEAGFTDAERELVTELPKDHPKEAVAKLVYTYNERKIGEGWLFTTRAQSVDAAAPPSEGESPAGTEPSGDGTGQEAPGFKLPTPLLMAGIGVLCLAAVIAGSWLWVKKRRDAERERQRQLREKRRQRLADIGFTEEDFERILEERRQQRDMR
ncbi:serine hydrolase [Lachnoclostridium pacaense]|uniref:D-alanyl-D-alanine carboxypeptidase family protein n=1 Tax=Enterocloster hominis (ex Hitch et al. 2024) TaxID=1917870 RepID=UPI001D101C2A|nr:D-alanyl-D-alanine carboxypeptidase family protein [Lachnoclostridium pacaense]MCC2875496.1 serine hydrolase [Lachnoclostridium pacaense]